MLYSFALLTAEAADFKLTSKDTTVQLGKPVWLDIQTDQARPSLDSIDFTPVANQFEVVKDKNEIRRNTQGQLWRIRLYPRQTGQQSITGLHFQAQAAQPITIQVEHPIDSKTGQPFTITHSLDHVQPWIRQQVLLRYEVTAPIAKLVLEPQPSTASNMLITPLSTQTLQQADHYRHRTGWALYPRQAGQQTIQLPALHYIRDGVTTHHFYPLPIKLEVKPLPAYLPGNLPVGRLSLQAKDIPSLLLKNQLSEIQLQLHGEGIPLQWLPDLRPLFRASAGMTLYPAELNTQQNSISGISSQHNYHLPVKATAQGRLSLPNTSLHYFDPTTGRLAQLTLPSQSMTSLSLWLVILLVLIVVTFIAWVLTKAYAWFLPRWRCFKTYRDALKTLPELKTVHDFRQLIRRLSEAEGWPGNLSLRQWIARLPVHTNRHAEQIIQQLEMALYQGKRGDIDLLRSEFKQLCINQQKILAHIS